MTPISTENLIMFFKESIGQELKEKNHLRIVVPLEKTIESIVNIISYLVKEAV